MTLCGGQDYRVHSIKEQTEAQRGKMAHPGSLKAGFQIWIILEAFFSNRVLFRLSLLTELFFETFKNVPSILFYIISVMANYILAHTEFFTAVRISAGSNSRNGTAGSKTKYTW